MPRFKHNYAVLSVFGLMLAFVPSAQAAFLFCNKTQTVIEAAFGYREQLDWVSEGWWQLQPGLCARVHGKPLTQRFYFYYARALAQPKPGERPPMTWSGKYALCADNKAFKVVGDQDCETRGFRTLYFQQADVGQNQRDYTLNFEDGSR